MQRILRRSQVYVSSIRPFILRQQSVIFPLICRFVKLINYGFLVLAMNAGLDSGIMDPTNKDMLGLVYATEALLGLDDYVWNIRGLQRRLNWYNKEEVG